MNYWVDGWRLYARDVSSVSSLIISILWGEKTSKYLREQQQKQQQTLVMCPLQQDSATKRLDRAGCLLTVSTGSSLTG